MSEAEIADLRETFKALDANGDGFLTVTELRDGIDQAQLRHPLLDLDAVVEGVDADGKASPQTPPATGHAARGSDVKVYLQRDVCFSAFAVFDQDGDGRITLEELKQILENGEVEQVMDGCKSEDLLRECARTAAQEFMEMMRGGRSMSLSMETTTPKSKVSHPRSPNLLRSRSKASRHDREEERFTTREVVETTRNQRAESITRSQSHAGDVQSMYKMQNNNIGEGTYGSVAIGVHNSTGAKRAIKTMSKANLKLGPHVVRFQQEIAIMKSMDHPNIIKLYETFEDRKHIYLAMELCTGGRVWGVPKDAAIVVQQMLSAVFYMHKRQVCHRDLKPENFLFLTLGIT
eukprot:g13747.t1